MPFKIGLPPPARILGDTTPYEDLAEASFFRVDVVPCIPKLSDDIQLYSMQIDFQQYLEKLNEILSNVTTSGKIDVQFSKITTWKPLEIYAIADTPVSEQFTGQYDESFISKIANAAGTGIAEIRQILGVRNLQQLNQQLKNLQTRLGQQGGNINDMLAMLVGGAIHGSNALQSALNAVASQPVQNLLLGHKIEFPKVWRDSSYAPSYTFTVRLYNPNPASESSTFKHIIKPLAAILLFVVPYSKDGYTYDWPFFCKAYAPGLFSLKYAAITDISITKGGDSLAFAFNQVPGIIDIRLTITDLFTTLLGGNAHRQSNIVDYLTVLAKGKAVKIEEKKLSISTSLEVPLTTRTSTSKISPSAKSAWNTLTESQLEDNIQRNWPSTLPTPSQDTLNDLVDVTKDPDVVDIQRDYERALKYTKEKNIINNVRKAASTSKPSSTSNILQELQNKTIISKQSDGAIQFLMNNPTDSTILNNVLRTIAQRAKNTPNPVNSIISALLNMNTQTIRPYAKRSLDPVLYSKSELAVIDEYPNITSDELSKIISILGEYILKQAETKIFG